MAEKIKATTAHVKADTVYVNGNVQSKQPTSILTQSDLKRIAQYADKQTGGKSQSLEKVVAESKSAEELTKAAQAVDAAVRSSSVKASQIARQGVTGEQQSVPTKSQQAREASKEKDQGTEAQEETQSRFQAILDKLKPGDVKTPELDAVASAGGPLGSAIADLSGFAKRNKIQFKWDRKKRQKEKAKDAKGGAARDAQGRFVKSDGSKTAKVSGSAKAARANEAEQRQADQLDAQETTLENTDAIVEHLERQADAEEDRHKELIETLGGGGGGLLDMAGDLMDLRRGKRGRRRGRDVDLDVDRDRGRGRDHDRRRRDLDVDYDRDRRRDVDTGYDRDRRRSKTPDVDIDKPRRRRGKLGAILGAVGLGGLGVGAYMASGGDGGSPVKDMATDVATDVVLDKVEDKVSGEATEKATKKVGTEATETVAKKATKEVGTEATEVAAKKVGKKAGGKVAQEAGEAVVKKGVAKGAARMLGPIVAAGFAGYDAYKGFTDTEMQREAYGLKEGQEADVAQKTNAGLANVLDMGGLGTGVAQLAGFDVDTGDIARNIDDAGQGIIGEIDNALGGWFGAGPTKDEQAETDDAFFAARQKARRRQMGIEEPGTPVKKNEVEGEKKSPKSAEVQGEKDTKEEGEAVGEAAGAVIADAVVGAMEKNGPDESAEDKEEKGWLDKIKGFFGFGGDDKKKRTDEGGAGLIDRFSSFLGIGGETKPADGSPPSKAKVKAASAMAHDDLGALSERYESGGRGAGTVSTGKGDRGGVSYGTYQMSSKMGVADKFVKQSEYADQFAGMKGGTREFSAKWKDLAANDPEFGKAQHEYIKQTHYDPLIDKVKGDMGIDLSSRSKAVQDAVWSTGVQHGGRTSIINKALRGKDTENISDEEIIKAIYAERGKRNASGDLAYFKSSSSGVQQGVANRFQNEKSDALAMLAAEKQVKEKPSKMVAAKGMVQIKDAKPSMDATPKSVAPRVAKIEQREVKPERIQPETVTAGPGAGSVGGGNSEKLLADIAASMKKQEKQGEGKKGAGHSKGASPDIPINFDDAYLQHKSLDLV